MARVTDPQKIEKLRRATMEIIADSGYHAVSTSSIAKLAGVSMGYLYRHYASKDELIQDLIRTHFMESRMVTLRGLKNKNSVGEIIYEVVSTIFHWAKIDPIKGRFVVRLLQDLDLRLDIEDRFIKDEENKLEDILNRSIELAKNNGQLNPKVKAEEIILVLTTVPLKYISNVLKRENYRELLEEEHIKRISEICWKALK